jgi:hypothetical protein
MEFELEKLTKERMTKKTEKEENMEEILTDEQKRDGEWKHIFECQLKKYHSRSEKHSTGAG